MYEFSHAIVRHAIYEELNRDRRARLHRRIATAIQQLGESDAHAAEVAYQYHASAALPGAESGVPFALVAAERARNAHAYEQAASFLRMARDLLPEADEVARANVLAQLATAEAEALLFQDAERTAYTCLAALHASSADGSAVAELTARMCRTLVDGGASKAVWEPLAQRGLAQIGDGRGLAWARLTLLFERTATLASGEIHAVRWLGHDGEAVAILRREGTEDDYARTLRPT